jgi:predicted transcriptional regulator
MPSTPLQLAALTERHYSVKDLAEMWGLSPAAIRRLFRDEPGVLRFGKEKRGHRRDYMTLRIPASVAERVYRRCTRPGFVTVPDQDKKKAVS